MIAVVPSPRRHGARIDVIHRLGHDLVVLENRTIRVTVCVSKGADILELRYKPWDLDVLWQGPHTHYRLGEYVPPAPASPFLDYFTCGWQEVLPNGGGACVHRGAQLGQHGEVAILPWLAELVRDEADHVEVAFSVRTHRTPFRLVRRMRLDEASPTVWIEEEVVNDGREDLEYMWGHHPGFGPPFLEPGCVIDLPGGVVVSPGHPPRPGGRLAAGHASKWPTGRGPAGEEVRLDVFPPLAAESDEDFHVEQIPAGWAALRNPNLGVGVALEWDQEAFPYLWCWIVAQGSSGYPYYGRLVHVALEPFSSPIGSLAENVARGLAPTLAAGARATASLAATIFEGRGRVTAVTAGRVTMDDVERAMEVGNAP